MLNRRQAIVSTSGALLLGGARLSASEVQASTTRRGVSTDLIDSDAGTEMAQAAEACLNCAIACDDLLTHSSVSEDTRSLAADCRDICTVTATLLSRGDTLSPAICQSCRDACSRLAARDSVARESSHQCAEACRKVLIAGSNEVETVGSSR